jgi:uncharacterized ferredoxin-like protein
LAGAGRVWKCCGINCGISRTAPSLRNSGTIAVGLVEDQHRDSHLRNYVSVHTEADSEATALVFVNANRTTPQTRGIPSIKVHLSSHVTMRRYSSRWLIANMTVVTPIDKANTSRPSAASALCRGH